MTQAVLLKATDILSEVLKVAPVRETDWFKSTPPEDLLLKLTEELSAAPVRGTNFLRVSMQCRNPKDPAIIVNEVVRRWHDSVRKRAAENFADEPLEASKTELEAIDRDMAELNSQIVDIVSKLPAGATQGFGESVLHQKVQRVRQGHLIDEVLRRTVRGGQIEIALLHQHFHVRVADNRMRQVDAGVSNR